MIVYRYGMLTLHLDDCIRRNLDANYNPRHVPTLLGVCELHPTLYVQWPADIRKPRPLAVWSKAGRLSVVFAEWTVAP